MNEQDDRRFMSLALEEARLAASEGEVPIGALVVSQGVIVGRGHNQVERLTDSLAHAEILALTAAQASLGAKYLPDCTLYVSLEPCPMCMGAIRLAQVGRVVYAAPDEKMGYTRLAPGVVHPRTKIESGLMGEEARTLMQNFFRAKRSHR